MDILYLIGFIFLEFYPTINKTLFWVEVHPTIIEQKQGSYKSCEILTKKDI